MIRNGAALGCSITGGDPPATGPAPGENFTNLSAGGLFVASKHDLHVAAPMPIDLTRVYRTRDLDSGSNWLAGPFGVGTNIAYNMFLYSSSEVNSGTYTNANVVLPNGGQAMCTCNGSCSGSSGTFQCSQNPGPFFGATIGYNSSTQGWNLTDKHGTVYSFGAGAPLQSITDRYGNSITVTRSEGATGNITQLTSSNGRYISFTYGDSSNPNQITKATDNSGRYATYAYDSNHRMTSSVDAAGTTTTYGYVNTGNQLGDLNSATLDPGSGSHLKLTGTAAYNASFQLKTLTGLLGNESYTYPASNECNVTTTPNSGEGNPVTRKLFFNYPGYVIFDERAAGTSIEADYTYNRDSSGNLITSVLDPLVRTTSYCYDSGCIISAGNITGITYAAGTSSAATYSYGYSYFNELASITDPLGHTWSAVIDSHTGNVDSVTVPSSPGGTWNMTYNTQGQTKSIADPYNVTTSYGYGSQGDLISITNGANNTTTFGTDTLGRVTVVTDPVRETTSYAYDNLDRVTQMVDPNSNSTYYYYDPASTLTKVTDPNGHSQTFTPSYTLGIMTQTDAQGNEWQFFYDAFGNLAGTIDGRGLETNYTYDGLNRLKTTQYNTASDNIAYTWDAGNRLTKAVDSGAGTINRGYDLFDNLTSDQSLPSGQGPQGTVSYTYDAASRRTAMTVPNQSQVNYLYDNANQLCVITQGSSLPGSCPTSYTQWSSGETMYLRAANGMVVSTFLPNGADMGFDYNLDYTLSAVGGAFGSSLLYYLVYSRDAAGRVTQVRNYAGTPPPTVNIPAAVPSPSYLPNNQLSKWNGTSVTEDGNGNLNSDGLGHSFTWNDRNQLSRVGGGANIVTFWYDGLGRRYKTLLGLSSATNFLYDGLNPVQEQNTPGTNANLLTGLGLDQIFTRTDSSGTAGLLRDAIGSTYGLTNSSGNSVQTTYTYGPFGQTTSSGTSNANPYQFTGRELDPNSGLYFMRNRYYSPTLSRFISSDPSGLAGGDVNLYSYVHNNPTNATDPLGLSTGGVGGGGGGGGGPGWYRYPSPHPPGGGPPGSGPPGSDAPGGTEVLGGFTVNFGPGVMNASEVGSGAYPTAILEGLPNFGSGLGGGGVTPIQLPGVPRRGPGYVMPMPSPPPSLSPAAELGLCLFHMADIYGLAMLPCLSAGPGQGVCEAITSITAAPPVLGGAGICVEQYLQKGVSQPRP